ANPRRQAAGSTPSPPPRSPIQSVWVASLSAVAMASFSNVVDTRLGPERLRQDGLECRVIEVRIRLTKECDKGRRFPLVHDPCDDLRCHLTLPSNPSTSVPGKVPRVGVTRPHIGKPLTPRQERAPRGMSER